MRRDSHQRARRQIQYVCLVRNDASSSPCGIEFPRDSRVGFPLVCPGHTLVIRNRRVATRPRFEPKRPRIVVILLVRKFRLGPRFTEKLVVEVLAEVEITKRKTTRFDLLRE